MKAFVTSIGEATTQLCVWSLERQGIDVTLIQDDSSLADKLERIYNEAEGDFIRVDADVIVNRNLALVELGDNWWVQCKTFGWYAQDLVNGGVQFISKKALPYLRQHVHECKQEERPESYMFRLQDFHNPRRCVTTDVVCGIHGYGQTQEDVFRVKLTKARRGQMPDYDFELAERISEL